MAGLGEGCSRLKRDPRKGRERSTGSKTLGSLATGPARPATGQPESRARGLRFQSPFLPRLSAAAIHTAPPQVGLQPSDRSRPGTTQRPSTTVSARGFKRRVPPAPLSDVRRTVRPLSQWLGGHCGGRRTGLPRQPSAASSKVGSATRSAVPGD